MHAHFGDLQSRILLYYYCAQSLWPLASIATLYARHAQSVPLKHPPFPSRSPPLSLPTCCGPPRSSEDHSSTLNPTSYRRDCLQRPRRRPLWPAPPRPCRSSKPAMCIRDVRAYISCATYRALSACGHRASAACKQMCLCSVLEGRCGMFWAHTFWKSSTASSRGAASMSSRRGPSMMAAPTAAAPARPPLLRRRPRE